MTTSRLWPSTNGPASVTAYSGNFLAGIAFRCIAPKTQWLQGYWMWVCPSGDMTTARKFALWAEISSSAAQLVPGSVVTSGTLVAGQWNYVPLATPIPLSPATAYIAAVGWAPTGGFPFTGSQFNSGGPYASGLTSGNLFAYSDGTAGGTAGTQNPTVGGQQGLFSTAGTDPSVNCPTSGSSSANFWIDLQVSDTAPAGYTGSYSLWPANFIGNQSTGLDLNVNYNVATEIAFSQPVQVQAIRYLSPATAANLATRAAIWSVTSGGLSGAEAAVIASPSWSGAAGSGWVQANFASPPVLPAGKYRVGVYNANGTVSPGWNAKDSITGAWGTGLISAGISNGVLSAPGLSAASTCYDYNGSAPGATPPYSAGTTEAGQAPFGQLPSGSDGVPYLYAGPSQNYFVDVVVTPVTASGLLLAVWP